MKRLFENLGLMKQPKLYLLSLCYPGGKRFQTLKYCIVCLVSKSIKNIKKLSKIHYRMFMLQYHQNIEYSLSIHLFYGWFYLLILSCRMVTKGCSHLQQLKDAGLLKFLCCFGTTLHERANKVNVHDYPFYPARNY